MRITIDLTETEARAAVVERGTGSEPSPVTVASEPSPVNASAEPPPIDGGAPPEALISAVEGTTGSAPPAESGSQPGDGGGPPQWLLDAVATGSLARFRA